MIKVISEKNCSIHFFTSHDNSSCKKSPWFKNTFPSYLYIVYISLYLDKSNTEGTGDFGGDQQFRDQQKSMLPTDGSYCHSAALRQSHVSLLLNFIFMGEHNAAAYLKRGNNVKANLARHAAPSKQWTEEIHHLNLISSNTCFEFC